MTTSDLAYRTFDRVFGVDPVSVGARAAFKKLPKAEQIAIRLQHGDNLIPWYKHRILQELIDRVKARTQ